jgi:PAS domain S-box-containing protein
LPGLHNHERIDDAKYSYLKRAEIRFVIIICLLVADVVFAPMLKVGFTLPTMLLLCSIALLCSLISLVWTLWGKWLQWSVYFVTFIDLLLITIAIHYLGGIESTFSWVYVVVLIAIALLHGVKIGVYFAAISSVMYSALLFAEFSGTIRHIDFNVINPQYLHDDPFYLHDKLVSTYILLFISAGVTGYLSQKLRHSQNELEQKVARRTQELTASNKHLQQEIFERSLAEEALRTSEMSYRLLAENVTDIIWTTDLNLRFTYVSPSVNRMLGYTVGEAITKRIDEILTPNSLQAASKAFAEELAMENEERMDPSRSRTLELEHFTKVQSTLWTEVKVTFLRGQDGRPVGILGVTRDITEQKHLRQQLLQAQKMESIGTLAGGIAHDFNNLLTGILGYASLIKTKFSEERQMAPYIDTIEKSAIRAAELTAQLLAFARGGKYATRPINLNGIIEETLKIIGRTFDKSIVIDVYARESLPTVEADAGQLQQVLMNLCVNARDAMPDGGTLTLETDVATLGEDYMKTHAGAKAGAYVVLSVNDTGVGMNKETMQRIFEPFFTTKEEGKGTGLGLSMVYGVVKNHDGHVCVYSEPGEGSTFKVYLPVSGKYATPQEPPEDVSPLNGNELILVVDDEELVRSLAMEMLECYGYRVLVAEDGATALEALKQKNGSIDLVILDMVMPKMAGRETFLKMKEINPQVKVLLSSGYSQNGKAREILESGIKGFLQKPYQLNSLLSKVRKALDQDCALVNREESPSQVESSLREKTATSPTPPSNDSGGADAAADDYRHESIRPFPQTAGSMNPEG